MSPVEQVRALWAAFASGGALASLEHVDEECEWLPPPDLPDGRAVRGGEALRAYFQELAADGIRFEPTMHTCEAVADDIVVAGGRMRIVAPSVLSDSPQFWLYRLRGGRVARVESYGSRRDALDAALAR